MSNELSLPVHSVDYDEETADVIRTDGWTSVSFVGGDDPCYAHTIGNHARGLPELLVMSDDCDMANSLEMDNSLEAVCERMREQNRPFKDGELVDVGGLCPVKVIDARDGVKSTYTCEVGFYYKTNDYAVQQVLLPDKQGRYAGDADCEPPYSLVPVLEVGALSGIREG